MATVASSVTDTFPELLADLGDPPGELVLEQKQLPAGRAVFRAGAVADRFYYVHQGVVALHCSVRSGEPMQLVRAGELLGWSWLVPPYRWRFDAVVSEPVVISVLDGRRLRERCDADHDLAAAVFRRVSQLIAHRLAAASHAEEAPTPQGPVGDGLDALLGDSPGIVGVRQLIPKLAASPAPVLITGESGTGKELVARALHLSGPRRMNRFVAENCAALPESLLESELFGYGPGAFTGAEKAKPGLFEAADGGTLFLDEIADTSPAVQAKLLRALESGEIRRLGETETRRINVRVVAATSGDLNSRLASGRFRSELFYRLGVLAVDLPPLRERHEDVPTLAQNFLELFRTQTGKEVPGFTSEALEALTGYSWPGNVRELRNVVERAATLVDPGTTIDAEHLSEQVNQCGDFPCRRQEGESLSAALQRIKSRMIEDAQADCGGNLTRTAKVLGMSRANLQSTMRRLGLR